MSADSFKSCSSSSSPAVAGSPTHALCDVSALNTNANSEGRILYELPEESPPASPLVCERPRQAEGARATSRQSASPVQSSGGGGGVSLSCARTPSQTGADTQSSSSFKRLLHGLTGRRSSKGGGGSDRVRMSKIQEQIRRLSGQHESPEAVAAELAARSLAASVASTAAAAATSTSCVRAAPKPDERDWSRYLREWERIEPTGGTEPPHKKEC